MKLFVTDAQLAGIVAEAEGRLRDTFTAWYAELQKGPQAEIDRLREDRREELARLVDPQAPFIAHLRDEVAFWRLQFLKERQRAEIAIDACRVQHQGVPPVALPLRPQGEGGATAAEHDRFADPELAAMGLIEGVG